MFIGRKHADVSRTFTRAHPCQWLSGLLCQLCFQGSVDFRDLVFAQGGFDPAHHCGFIEVGIRSSYVAFKGKLAVGASGIHLVVRPCIDGVMHRVNAAGAECAGKRVYFPGDGGHEKKAM